MGGGALASLHVDAFGRKIPFDANARFWGSWQRLLLEAVERAGAQGFPLRGHGATGHADILEAKIWVEMQGVRENPSLDAAGSWVPVRRRYLAAALRAHRAAALALARPHWLLSAGFHTQPRTG